MLVTRWILRYPRMGDLARQQRTRHHPDDLAVFGERGVGQGAHHSDVAPAVDELPPASGDRRPVASRRRDVRRVVAIARAAKHTH